MVRRPMSNWIAIFSARILVSLSFDQTLRRERERNNQKPIWREKESEQKMLGSIPRTRGYNPKQSVKELKKEEKRECVWERNDK